MNLRRIALLSSLIMLLPLCSASAAPVYVFPVADCVVDYAHAHHDYAATDILAKKGCKFVAPINGVVDEVNRIDSWSGKTNLGIDRGELYVSITPAVQSFKYKKQKDGTHYWP